MEAPLCCFSWHVAKFYELWNLTESIGNFWNVENLENGWLLHVYIPKAHCSEGPLVRKAIGPKGPWSEFYPCYCEIKGKRPRSLLIVTASACTVPPRVCTREFTTTTTKCCCSYYRYSCCCCFYVRHSLFFFFFFFFLAANMTLIHTKNKLVQ